MMRNVGILGLGSIGRRHARILNSIDKNIDFFAYRTKNSSITDTPKYIKNIDKQGFYSKSFDLIIISNPSSMHLITLKEVLKTGNTKKIFVEKPFCLQSEINECKKLLSKNKKKAIIPGNSFRFHPAIDIIKKIIKSKKLGRPIECLAHFGTSMPDWHPYEDYRKSYASRKDLGGGVMHTSIHELDLVCHLFGKPKLQSFFTSNVFLKEIDVEDVAHILLTMDNCKTVNVSLNYYQKPLSRFLKICFEKGTVSWNFMDKFLSIQTDKKDDKKKIDNRIDAMYENMWKDIIKNKMEKFEMESVYNSLIIINQISN